MLISLLTGQEHGTTDLDVDLNNQPVRLKMVMYKENGHIGDTI
jgi:hypothetical protein